MRRRPGIALLLGAFVLLFAVLLFRPTATDRMRSAVPAAVPQATAPEEFRLRPGESERRDLIPGASHVYPFKLKSGWLLHLSVEQQGVDAFVRVMAPDGTELFQVDSPTGIKDREEVWLVADPPGEYRIVVEAGKGEGKYEARIAELRPASADDRRNAEAERTFHQARRLAKTGAARERVEPMFLSSVRIWRSLGRTQRQADAWYRIGDGRSGAGDRHSAKEAYRRSRQLYRAVGALRFEAGALIRIAEVCQEEGTLDEARRAWTESLPLWQWLKDRENERATENRLCQVDHLAGLGRKALECYERAFEAWKALHNPREQGVVRVDQGTLYTSLGDIRNALSSYRVALTLLKEPADRSAALTQLGNAYLRTGSFNRALSQFRTALVLSRKAQDPEAEAAALNGMGLAWQQAGKLADADPPLRRALSLFEEHGDLSSQATVWTNLGLLRLAQNESLQALEFFQNALKKAATSGNRGAEATALSGMARAELRRGNPIAARDRIERALDVVESVRTDAGRAFGTSSRLTRSGFFVDVLKANYMASKQDDYELLINLLMERKDDAPAFRTAERMRARSLSDALARQGEERLPEAMSLDEVQRQVLDGDTVLLEYSLGKDRSYLWWVAREGHRSFVLPGRETLESAARRLRELISRSARPGGLAPARRQAEALSRILLGPVADLLDGRRVVVVLPDVLGYVPFEALPDPAVRGGGELWPAPLLAGREVVRLPSASVLFRLRMQRAGRKPAPGLLAIVGDPVFSPRDDRLPPGLQAGNGADDRLPPLPFAGPESKAITDLAQGGEVLTATGFNATRELVLSGALGRYALLHFLAHGLVDTERPEESALMLSRFDRRGRPIPGRLRAGEIRGLHLAADLVVLSACDTGLGRVLRGEGLVGLAHSFLAAGASDVVVTLWSVEDRATSVFMERFYRELLTHRLQPSAALRAVQLSLWRDPRWGAPSYWSGFVMEGDWINKVARTVSP